MKKNIVIIISLLIISCKDKTKIINNKDLEKKAIKEKIEQIPEENVNYNIDEMGFELMQTETLNELKLGLNVKKIEKLLGKPENTSEKEIWEADGEFHQTYFYSNLGIELDIIGENKTDQSINMITITNPCKYKTSKNISIESTYEEVKKAYLKYFNPEFSNSETIVAGSIYGGVIFTFKNDKVISIFIGASAE